MRYDNRVSPIGEGWEQEPGIMFPPRQFTTYPEAPSGVAVLEGNLSLQRALWRMFENEGRQVTITFSSETVLAGDERAAPPAQTSVIASVLLPFGWDELVARVSSTQPVESQPTERNVFRFGDVCVDMLAMEVTRFQGVRVNLTAQEFKMLKFFLANPGRVISREELLNEAWGYENYPCTRTVDNHVLRLRQKLEIDPSEPVHFQTVIRVGYKFVKGEKVGTNSLELVR